ncbi:SRPBCC domain-containing protein [Paenibacillus sp. OV219]|uniref:SRPBCC family protein n=1 Tax=Paenibacillus sp. OV219 TaxID=1884377 RepID=UPI0008D0FE35|nr:SRPBCC domain-containing protein [Paenibacillus sp. OV219]SEO80069.1 Uncharacterized conserved protein YndB, AHSA1/START domain [Paenibacillus sp. OV219]
MGNNETTNQELLVITRTINAPRVLVFKVWTEAEHLKHWFGPADLDLEILKLDVHPGGMFHYSMRFPDGNFMWSKNTYQEVVVPEKLVYISSFTDAEGNVIPAPIAPDFPLEVMNTLTFTESNGQTILTLQSAAHQANTAQQAFYQSLFDSMQQGFGSMFDQLEVYLAAQN